MSILDTTTKDMLLNLYKTCRSFIDDHEIICPEKTIDDKVYENAPEFIEKIANIIGYYKEKDI